MLIIFHLAYFNTRKESAALAGDRQGVFCREEGKVSPTCRRVEKPEKSDRIGEAHAGELGLGCPSERSSLRRERVGTEKTPTAEMGPQ